MGGPPPRYDAEYFRGLAYLNDLERCDGFNPCGDCCRCRRRRKRCGICPACLTEIAPWYDMPSPERGQGEEK